VINTPKGQVTFPAEKAMNPGAIPANADIVKAEWESGRLVLQLRLPPVNQTALPSIRLDPDQLQQILSRLPPPQSASGKPLTSSFWIERGVIPVVIQATVTAYQLLLSFNQKAEPVGLSISADLAKLLNTALNTGGAKTSVSVQIALTQSRFRPGTGSGLAPRVHAAGSANSQTLLKLVPALAPATRESAGNQSNLSVPLDHQAIAALTRIGSRSQLIYPASVLPTAIKWPGPDLEIPPNVNTGSAFKQAKLLLQFPSQAQKAQPLALLSGPDGSVHPIKLSDTQASLIARLLKEWQSWGADLSTGKLATAGASFPAIPQNIKQALSEPTDIQLTRLKQLFQPLLQARPGAVPAVQTALVKQGLTELLLDAVQAKEQGASKPLHHGLKKVLDRLPEQQASVTALQKPPTSALLSLLEPILQQVADSIPKASDRLEQDITRPLGLPEPTRVFDLLSRPPANAPMDRLTQAIALLLGIRIRPTGSGKLAWSALEQFFLAWNKPVRNKDAPQLGRILERLRADPDSNAQLREITRALGKSTSQQRGMLWQGAEQRVSGINQPFVFPIQLDEQLHLVEGRIYQEQEPEKTPDQDQKQRAWKLQLRFDFPNTGPILVNARWQQQSVDIEVFSEKETTRQKASEKMELWRQRLDRLGLNPGQLSCKLGKVPQQLHQSVSRIIQTEA
jgi:hypothetical protein